MYDPRRASDSVPCPPNSHGPGTVTTGPACSVLHPSSQYWVPGTGRHPSLPRFAPETGASGPFSNHLFTAPRTSSATHTPVNDPALQNSPHLPGRGCNPTYTHPPYFLPPGNPQTVPAQLGRGMCEAEYYSVVDHSHAWGPKTSQSYHSRGPHPQGLSRVVRNEHVLKRLFTEHPEEPPESGSTPRGKKPFEERLEQGRPTSTRHQPQNLDQRTSGTGRFCSSNVPRTFSWEDARGELAAAADAINCRRKGERSERCRSLQLSQGSEWYTINWVPAYYKKGESCATVGPFRKCGNTTKHAAVLYDISSSGQSWRKSEVIRCCFPCYVSTFYPWYAGKYEQNGPQSSVKDAWEGLNRGFVPFDLPSNRASLS